MRLNFILTFWLEIWNIFYASHEKLDLRDMLIPYVLACWFYWFDPKLQMRDFGEARDSHAKFPTFINIILIG